MTSLPYEPDAYSNQPSNLFGAGQTDVPFQPLDRLHFRSFRVMDASGQPIPDELGWEWVITDLRGGYRDVGDMEEYRSSYESSTLLTTNWGRAILQFLRSNATLTDNNGGYYFGHNYANRLAIGSGSAANASLYAETSLTNPALSARTFTPGGVICSLSEGIFGGATSARSLCIGFEGATAVAVSDLAATPTSAGTFHTDVNPLWDIVISPLNATTPGTPMNIVYYAGGIGTIPSSSAITVAPTVVLSGVPGGGYALRGSNTIGIDILENETTPRIWYFWPLTHRTTSVLNDDSNANPNAGQVVSLAMDGSDPSPAVPFPLARVYYPVLWEHKAVATDGVQIAAYRGNGKSYLLPWVGEGAPDSNIKQFVHGLAVDGPDLYAFVARVGVTSAGFTYRLRKFVPQINAWTTVQSTFTAGDLAVSLSGAGAYGLGANVGQYASPIPISKTTGFMHHLLGSESNYHFMEPPGIDTWLHYRQTGSDVGIAQEFATTGTWTSPKLRLPGVHKGHPFHVDEIGIGGDRVAGGATTSNGKITVTATTFGGSAVSEYNTATQGLTEWHQNPDQTTQAHELQVTLQLDRNSGDTNQTPNGLPVYIRGRTKLPKAKDYRALPEDLRGR